MAKKEKKEKVFKDTDIKVKKKKKMTKHEKRSLVMKVVAWIMALVMVLGTIASFLSYFIGR